MRISKWCSVTPLFFYLVLFVFTVAVQAQVVYAPVDHEVFAFLERLSLQKIITFHNEVRPLSRLAIARLLSQAESHINELNTVEQEAYHWYRREFAAELREWDMERYFVFKYRDSAFAFTISPVAGYGISKYGSENGHTRWWGLKTWGTYGEHFGASFEYRDNSEYGGTSDKARTFSPKTGYFINFISGDAFDYSDVKGSVSYNWSGGSVSLIKDYSRWGHGEFGQLILSNKAASFPHVRMILQPADWFRFYYMHGWLNSLVYDSAYFRFNRAGTALADVREKYIDKYIVANMLSITPFEWLDASIGNSYVYGGSARWEMWLPFMYYKVMDHNTGRQGIDDGNGLIFSDWKVTYPKSYAFYATCLIDVLNVRDLLKGKWWKSWFGFTIGGKKVDFIFQNLDVVFEYSRLNPWLYENRDEVATYKHLNYVLGHWIGQNADETTLQFRYKPRRDLAIEFIAERIRKGGLKDLALAYNQPTKQEFLYSPLRSEYSIGIGARYEPFCDVFTEMQYRYADISDESNFRTSSYMLGGKHSFSLSLSYGM